MMDLDSGVCAVWMHSKQLAEKTLNDERKTIDKLESKRDKIGANLRDAEEKLFNTEMELESIKVTGGKTDRIEDAVRFYEINVKRFASEIEDIDKQIIASRNDAHDAVDRISFAESKIRAYC